MNLSTLTIQHMSTQSLDRLVDSNAQRAPGTRELGAQLLIWRFVDDTR